MHCWQSFSHHKDNVCKFYAQNKALGRLTIWANILIPIQYFIDTWSNEDKRSYIYAVFTPSGPTANDSFFHFGLNAVDPHHSTFQISEVRKDDVKEYSHHDLIFGPLIAGLLPHYKGRWGSPSPDIHANLEKLTEQFDCQLDSSENTEVLIMQCWYQQEKQSRKRLASANLEEPRSGSMRNRVPLGDARSY